MTTELVCFTQWARTAPQKCYTSLMGMLCDPAGLRESFVFYEAYLACSEWFIEPHWADEIRVGSSQERRVFSGARFRLRVRGKRGTVMAFMVRGITTCHDRYVLVFKPRHDLLRIISARKANQREVRQYENRSYDR